MTLLLEIARDAAALLFSGLVRASLQGALFVLLVWIVCRLWPRIPASVRCTLWWLAALKLIIAFAWIEPVAIRVLAPAAPPAVGAGAHLGPIRAAVVTYSAPAGLAVPSFEWTSTAVALWAAILMLLFAAVVYRVAKISLLAGRAGNAPPDLNKIISELSASLGLARVPRLRISAEIDTPLVTGFRNPIVLLPAARFHMLPVAGQRMALCHELIHLRRRDPWLALVPALAERLFFFHPLAHLAVREYGLAREAACDAGVLSALDAQPADYGQLLLSLGVARTSRHFAAAGASHSYKTLKRRITMLRNPFTVGKGLRVAAFGATTLAVCAIIPVKFVARPAEFVKAAQVPAVPAVPAFPAAALPIPAAPAPPAAPPALISPSAPDVTMAPARVQDLVYIFFANDRTRIMSASEADVSRAEQFRRQGERMLWFRRSGREYVSRDPGLLNEIEDVFKPLSEIGAKQGDVGARQGEIGARQGEIGSRQGGIGAKQGEVGARQAQIAALQSELSAREAAIAAARQNNSVTAAQAQELEKTRRELEIQMQQMSGQMNELSAQMRSLNDPMNELSKQMQVLSREMQELSRRMREASAKADEDLRKLLDRAIAAGTAMEVR